VIGIMAAVLASLHMQTANDLFGTPQGRPRTDNLIAASVQWAVAIMEKIELVLGHAPGVGVEVKGVTVGGAVGEGRGLAGGIVGNRAD
jgi:hypothetical protein